MLLCSAERGHVPQQYLLGPPLGNYRHSCESNKQVGSLFGEEKRPWRVQSKENRVQLGSAWRETGGWMVGSGYFISRVRHSAVL